MLTLLKPFLDTTTLIYCELEDHRVEKREEWLYERYSELRKLVKIIVGHSDEGGHLNWLDTMFTLDSLVSNFNLSLLSNS